MVRQAVSVRDICFSTCFSLVVVHVHVLVFVLIVDDVVAVVFVVVVVAIGIVVISIIPGRHAVLGERILNRRGQ